MPNIFDQRVFMPTLDFERSIEFYTRLGWREIFREEKLAMVELGQSRLFLQKYYVADWAGNMMLHLVVDDAEGWYRLAEQVISEGNFTEAKVRKPQREDYGALVTHLIDPAGVLIYLAQMDKPAESAV